MSLPAEEVTQFGSVTLFEVNIDDKWKLAKELGYVTGVSAKIIWEVLVQEVDSVISTAAKKLTIDYFMDKEE